ncbi:MAG: hypothetical protein HKL96_09010 [Phycisphaerales bacterium]|nr:hypothetical protein [Phycisphaerales bacterium]
MRNLFAIVLGLSALIAGGGCAVTPTRAVPDVVTCTVPEITVEAETPASQTKSGLGISVAPADYSVKLFRTVTYQPAQPPFAVAIIGTTAPSVYVRKTVSTVGRVAPDRIKFLLTIDNEMPRVFYGKGTVVQFDVGGRLQPVNQRGYTNLLGEILPPRQQQQITIVGPRLSSLTKPSGMIGLFLYDVVTKENEAGVVVEKENFHWYFKYTLEPRTTQASTQVAEGYMPVAQYQAVMASQAASNGQQATVPLAPAYLPATGSP